MSSETATLLAEKAAKAHRLLAMTGSMNDTTGHVFVRMPGTDQFLARGRNPGDWSPRYVTPAAMRPVQLDGTPTGDWGDYAPPPERFIGAELLKARPEVNAVIHAHPPAQILCSNLGVPLRPIVGSQNWGGAAITAKGVPVYPRSLLIHTPALGRAVATVLGRRDVVLLKHHGNVVVGGSVEEATVRAIAIENLARLAWQLRSAGGDQPPIPFEDLEDQAAVALNPGQLGGGPDWQWRYYEQMLERGARLSDEIDWS